MKLLESRELSVEEVMERDRQLLQHFSEPLLHLYSWKKPSATYGYFINPEELFRKDHPFDLGRRPTGGGALFHLSDLTFSLFIPKEHPLYRSETVDSYAVFHGLVQEALSPLVPIELTEGREAAPLHQKFCMAHPVKNDLVLLGKKVGGAAERRTKGGILHQAALFVAPPDLQLIKEALILGEEVAAEIERSSGYLTSDLNAFGELRGEIERRLAVVFKDRLQ